MEDAMRLSSVWYVIWILSSEHRYTSSAMSSLAFLFLFLLNFICIFCKKKINAIEKRFFKMHLLFNFNNDLSVFKFLFSLPKTVHLHVCKTKAGVYNTHTSIGRGSWVVDLSWGPNFLGFFPKSVCL